MHPSTDSVLLGTYIIKNKSLGSGQTISGGLHKLKHNFYFGINFQRYIIIQHRYQQA